MDYVRRLLFGVQTGTLSYVLHISGLLFQHVQFTL